MSYTLAILWTGVIVLGAPIAGFFARKPLAVSQHKPRILIYAGSAVNLLVIGAITGMIDIYRGSKTIRALNWTMSLPRFVAWSLSYGDIHLHYPRRFCAAPKIKSPSFTNRDVAVASDHRRADDFSSLVFADRVSRRISFPRFRLFHDQQFCRLAVNCGVNRDNLFRAAAWNLGYDRDNACVRARRGADRSSDNYGIVTAVDYCARRSGHVQRTVWTSRCGFVSTDLDYFSSSFTSAKPFTANSKSFAGMRGGHLGVDARGAVWNDWIEESNDVNAFLQYARGYL